MYGKLRILALAILFCGFTTSAFADEGDGGDGGEAAGGGGGGGDKPISAGLLLGYGISLEDGGNPWGVGLGVGGGYNIDAIYIGARFIYYLGDDPVNIWELGAEVGYDIDLSGITVRPGVGLGIANVTVDIPSFAGVGGGSASSSEFYLAPGAAALFDVSDSMFIGAEARLQLVMSDPTVKAFILMANGGMRF